MAKLRRRAHYRDRLIYKSKSHYRAGKRFIPHSGRHGFGGTDELDISGLKIWNHINTDVAVVAGPGDFIQADLSVRGSFTITVQETSPENDGRICVIQRVDNGRTGILTVSKTGGDQILNAALCLPPVDSFDVDGQGDALLLSWDDAGNLVKVY